MLTKHNKSPKKAVTTLKKGASLALLSLALSTGFDVNFQNDTVILGQSTQAQTISRNTIIKPNGTTRRFYVGQEWRTPSGYKFIFQRDKNLVLYNKSGRAVWATGSQSMDAYKITVQSDGNVVLYNPANKAIWATNTAGNANAYLAIQDDGNVVVYNNNSQNKPLWASNTAGGRSSGIFNAAARWQSARYLPGIESVLKSFFSNRSNTNNEDWSNKSITQMWDRIGGESAQFPGGAYTSGDRWQKDMPSEIYQVYKNLSTAILGSVKTVTTGYAYDQGYYNYYGKWHGGLDIGATNGTAVKAAVGGTTTLIQNKSGDHFLGVKGDDGRLWVYGHLNARYFGSGTRVSAGQALGTVGKDHLHLEVHHSHSYSYPSNSNRSYTLSKTMSPLQAYWELKNK